MNLREPFAHTHTASLEWGEQERAIDRIAAAGRCSPLGIALWKARYMSCLHFKDGTFFAYEKSAFRDCLRLLTDAYRTRYKADSEALAVDLVVQALAEWINQSCRDCGGARELVVGDLKVICNTCGGTGLHRYSDFERSRAMRISYAIVKHSRHKLQWLADQIGTEDRRVNYEMGAELERGY